MLHFPLTYLEVYLFNHTIIAWCNCNWSFVGLYFAQLIKLTYFIPNVYKPFFYGHLFDSFPYNNVENLFQNTFLSISI